MTINDLQSVHQETAGSEAITSVNVTKERHGGRGAGRRCQTGVCLSLAP